MLFVSGLDVTAGAHTATCLGWNSVPVVCLMVDTDPVDFGSGSPVPELFATRCARSCLGLVLCGSRLSKYKRPEADADRPPPRNGYVLRPGRNMMP
jgi:hypothetical protein